MFPSVETSRLSLGAFSRADLPAFAAYRNRPEVSRYQSWESFSSQDAEEFLLSQTNLQPGTPGRWIQFAVRLQTTGELIGDCGLCADAADSRLAEVGFTFSPAHQGRGLAREAVSGLLDYAFDALALHRVKAIVDRDNVRAIRLLERLGMRREGHFVRHTWFKGSWCDEFLYAILETEWTRLDGQELER